MTRKAPYVGHRGVNGNMRPQIMNIRYTPIGSPLGSRRRKMGTQWGKPWELWAAGKIFNFHTHAEAIAHVDKLAHELQEVP